VSSKEEKVHKIFWSPFLRQLLIALFIFLFVPHFLFWIPAWLQSPLIGLDLGWELLGDKALPSLLLNFFYGAFSIGFIVWQATVFSFKFSRFPIETKSDQVTFERIDIPVGGGHSLPADIVKGPLTPKKNAPIILLAHGMGGQRTDYYTFGVPLSFMGFASLLWDSRGHGENEGVFGQKWDTYYILKDVSRVVDYIENRANAKGDLDPNNIVAWGGSMGGGIVLNEAYLDRRVKFVIALCTWADFKMTATRKMRNFSERIVKAGFELMGINLYPTDMQNRLVSPIYNSFNKKKGFFGHPVYWEVDNDYRVTLAHCKNDQVVNFENFRINQDFLRMKRANYIVFEEGNHAFAGNETAIVGKMLLWFWMRGY
jgi:acetyl esterase/lipase